MMSLRYRTYLGVLFFVLLLCACGGYHLGGAKPPSLAAISSVAVPMFSNSTLHPRAEALATSAIANAFVSDGTYRLVDSDEADAVLIGDVRRVGYSTLRSSRSDTSLAEELTNSVTIEWQLVDAKDIRKVLARGSAKGDSSFYVDSNLQTARQNALPDAFERAGQGLVSKLASGF